jgi:hypothetical protein
VPLPVHLEDEAAARQVDGYVMLQAVPGLTGSRASLDPANAGRIASLRASVGLGADGVVVGSAALRGALTRRAEPAALLKDLRMGLDG